MLRGPLTLSPIGSGAPWPVTSAFSRYGPWAADARKDRLPMSFRPCSLCDQRKPGKFATLYAAWFDENEKRIAWKQRLCPDCLQGAYLDLLQNGNGDSTGSNTCPGCGGVTTDDLDPVYLTLYLPKREPLEHELGTCASCAAKLRVTMSKGSDRLEDRTVTSRGPSPSAPDPWTALGL